MNYAETVREYCRVNFTNRQDRVVILKSRFAQAMFMQRWASKIANLSCVLP